MDGNFRVLIADSLAALRTYAANIVCGIAPTTPCVYEASTGPAAVELAKTCAPSLIIMDVAMPVMNGIKAAAEIWAMNPAAKILFWTQYHREVYVRDLGRIVPRDAIHGYLLKNQPDEKLRYAIISVWMHDNPYIDPDIRRVASRSVHANSLSDREFETLQDLALGLTEKAISQRRHISIRGVQCRVASLYAKLIPNRQDVAGLSNQLELFNPRSRMLSEAIRRGLVEPDSLSGWEDELHCWLQTEYGPEAIRIAGQITSANHIL